MTNEDSTTPDFLRDYGALYSHFQQQFEDLSAVERGRKFAEFVQRLIPHIPLDDWKFTSSEQRQETHDGGVDFDATSTDGGCVLHVQSKYTIAKVDDIDAIFSKFRNFDHDRRNSQDQQLLDFGEDASVADDEPAHIYLVVTASDITGNLKKYETQNRGSKEFYEQLKARGACHFVHGRRLLELLQGAFNKSQVRPADLELRFVSPPVRHENVLVGVVAAEQLRALYQRFGESLFLENIREWLGEGGGREPRGRNRESPNEAMLDTLKTEPEAFLSRNNGVTFRAGKIDEIEGGLVSLKQASIVNGCQTTMSIVTAGERPAHVLVKAVETDDAWSIAKAANFQNPIDRIWLEIAQQIRPQLMRNQATAAGFSLRTEYRSAFAVLDVIYQQRITYEELRALFVGLFSRTPNNLFKNNYSELRADAMHALPNDPNKDQLYEALFTIQAASVDAAQATSDAGWSQDIANIFQRFWKDEKPNFRAYLTIVALCHFSGIDFTEGGFDHDYANIKLFLTDAASVIAMDKDKFRSSYLLAFKAIAAMVVTAADDKDRLLQVMYTEIERLKVSKALLMIHAISPN